MINPPEMSRFFRMCSGKRVSPEKSAMRRSRISPVRAHASVMARSNITLVVRSASCSVCMASSASGTSARTWAAAATTSWESLGFLFWGMVLLPTVPGGTGSSTSPNSCFISV